MTAAHEAVTDTPLARRPFIGLPDARFFSMDGVLGLVCGPRAKNIHGVDERVSIPSIRRVTKTIARFIADWCGTQPVQRGSAATFSNLTRPGCPPTF